MAKLNLSIYLIKKEISNFENIVEDCEILQNMDLDNIIYYDKSSIREPDWLSEFFNINNDHIRTANSKVIYLKRIKINDDCTRIFALTFGYGRSLLKEDVVEEQFGLKIVLNTIQRNKIRKITKIDIGKNYKQSMEQMPKESDIGEFGFDANRDLIRYVTGKSEDEIFGKSIITGGDIFNLTTERNITNISELLVYCYQKYELNTYKENFEWLDNIKLVRDKNLIKSLNNEIVNNFNNKDFSQVWLAIPDIVDWSKFKCIHIQGQANKDIEYNDIENEAFVDSFKDSTIQNFEQIKSKLIYVKSNENDDFDLYKWRAYKCIVGSIDYRGCIYAINSGNWYRIDKDFAKEINNSYNQIRLSPIQFIDCPQNMDEKNYNENLVKSITGSKLMHPITIPFGGGRGNSIEPCDVIYNKNLFYIKNNGGSSYLSHLFNQASVACQALKDDNFRSKFNEKLKERNMSEFVDDNFNANNYTITICIINRYADERPKIPFFSKVSIKYTAQLVTDLGYHFELKNIKRR